MKKKILTNISFIMLLISIIAVIFLGVLVHYHSVLKVDIYLSRDLQAEGDTPLDKRALFYFLSFVSIFGKAYITATMVSLVAAAFWLLKYYRETIFILLTPVAAGINFLVKILVNRPRPSGSLVNVIDRELDPSFPSGHVVFYVVFFGFLLTTMFFAKRIPLAIRIIVGVFCSTLIVAVSFSRVYLGAHWTSDVLAGYLLGFILLSVLLRFYLAPLLNPHHR